MVSGVWGRRRRFEVIASYSCAEKIHHGEGWNDREERALQKHGEPQGTQRIRGNMAERRPSPLNPEQVYKKKKKKLGGGAKTLRGVRLCWAATFPRLYSASICRVNVENYHRG